MGDPQGWSRPAEMTFLREDVPCSITRFRFSNRTAQLYFGTRGRTTSIRLSRAEVRTPSPDRRRSRPVEAWGDDQSAYSETSTMGSPSGGFTVGMSRPLLKFGGGSVEILRDVLH